MDCSWGEGNNACDGGEDFRAYQWIMKHGLASEEDYGPYLGAVCIEIIQFSFVFRLHQMHEMQTIVTVDLVFVSMSVCLQRA